MIWDRSRSERQGLHLLFSGYRSETKRMKPREIKRQDAGGNPQIVLHLFIHLSWGITHGSRIWKYAPSVTSKRWWTVFHPVQTWCSLWALLPWWPHVPSERYSPLVPDATRVTFKWHHPRMIQTVNFSYRKTLGFPEKGFTKCFSCAQLLLRFQRVFLKSARGLNGLMTSSDFVYFLN